MANNNQLNIEIKVNKKELADAKADLKSFSNELKMYSKAEVEEIKANAKLQVEQIKSTSKTKIEQAKFALQEQKNSNAQNLADHKALLQKELADYKAFLSEKQREATKSNSKINAEQKKNSSFDKIRDTADIRNKSFDKNSEKDRYFATQRNAEFNKKYYADWDLAIRKNSALQVQSLEVERKADEQRFKFNQKNYDVDRNFAIRQNRAFDLNASQPKKQSPLQNLPLNPNSLGGLKQQQDYYKQFISSLTAGSPALEETKKKINSLQTEIDKFGVSSRGATGIFDTFKNLLLGGGIIAGLYTIKNAISDIIQEANKLQAATIGLESIANFKGIDPKDATDTVRNLELVKNGLLTVSDASLGLKNLLNANFTMEQSIEILKRLGDTAAFNRQAGLDFGYAITSATEGLKNGNSILVDNAGLTKNLSIILKEAGFAETDVSKATSDVNIRLALFNGIVKETQGFVGDAGKLMETFAGQQQKLEAQTTITKQELGKLAQFLTRDFVDAANDAASATNKLINEFDKLAQEQGIVGIAIGELVKNTFYNLLFPGLGQAILLVGALKDAWNGVFSTPKKVPTKGMGDRLLLDSQLNQEQATPFTVQGKNLDMLKGVMDSAEERLNVATANTVEWKDAQKQYNSAYKEYNDLLKRTYPEEEKGRKGREKDVYAFNDFLRSLKGQIELQEILNKVDQDGLNKQLRGFEELLKANEGLINVRRHNITDEEYQNDIVKSRTDFLKEQFEILKKINQIGFGKAKVGTTGRPTPANGESDTVFINGRPFQPANGSEFSGIQGRTNVKNKLENSSSSPQTIGDINDKTYQEEQLLKAYDMIASNSSDALSNVQSILNVLNVGTETFVSQLVTGFQDVLGVVQSLVAVIKAGEQIGQGISLLSSILGFVPFGGLVGGAVGAIAGTSGGRNIGNLSSVGRSQPIVNKIYISSQVDTQKFFDVGVTDFQRRKVLSKVG